MFTSPDKRVAVGRYTYGDPVCKVWGESDRIEIGSFCSIAEGVVLFGGGEHRTDWISTYPFSEIFDLKERRIAGHPATKGPTRIGHDVWLGYESLVLSGVTVGHGAVVGARAVVTRDVPPYAIIAGNPAKVIRSRFSEELVGRLLALAWWEWPIEAIMKHAPLLSQADTAEAIGQLEGIKGSL